MKKIISIICVAALIMSLFAVIPAAAEETVLLQDNFDDLAEGKSPSKWKVTANAEKKLTVSAVSEEGNMIIKIACGEDGEAGGPRMTQKIPLEGMSDITISFKAKSDGKATVAFSLVSDGNAKGKATSLFSTKEKKWSDVTVAINLKNMKYTTTINGSKESAKSIHDIDDLTTTEFRATATNLVPGQSIYFDDFKFTTSGAAPAAKTESAPADTSAKTEEQPKIAAPPTGTTPPKAMEVPTTGTVFVKEDFSGVADGTAAGKLKSFSGGTAYGKTVKNGDNMTLSFYSDDGGSHGPRIAYQLAAPNIKKLFMDFAFKPSNGGLYLTTISDGGEKGKGFGNLSPDMSGVNPTEWNYVHYEFDLKNGVVSGTLNGKKCNFSNSVFTPVVKSETLELRINASVKDYDAMYLDNIVIYTDQEVKYEGMLIGDNKVNWEDVKPAKALSDSSFVNNLVSHPRILVTDFAKIKEKANLTNETKMWYNSLLANADTYYKSPAKEHVINSRGNVLESARGERDRLQALAFAYAVTGDKKYADKAYDDMVYCGDWPDWSGFKATLVTAEILWGYACAYDWCYDYYTPEQKATIREIMKRQGLTDYVYNYEGKQTNTNFTTTTINWNPVCNSVAIAAAFAIADEDKELAEYLLEKAPVLINNALPPYAPEGAYPEGTSYWDYGTSYLTFAMHYLETGFKEGYKLPDNYYYMNSPGISETCDFPIYMTGTTGRFMYGDASAGITTAPIFYWYANKFNKPYYAWYENKVQYENKFLGNYDAIACLCWYDPDNVSFEPGTFKLDKVYGNGTGFQGLSFRSSWEGNKALVGMMQLGYNSNNHSYRSVGTYNIDWRNKRFIFSPRDQDYALKESASKIYYKRAEGNNCLVINPTIDTDQIAKATAPVIASGSSENTAFGIADMTTIHDDFKSAKRGMMITDNRKRIIIQDEVEAVKPSEFYWYANTEAGIAVANDGKSVLLDMGEERMLVRLVKGPEDAKFYVTDRKSTVDGVLNTSKEGNKLALHMNNVTKLELCVEYVGLEPGEGIPDPWNYVPMDSWSANDNAKRILPQVGDATVLKINSPNAYAGGVKTYVDPANKDVVPVIINDRTLVPVRFISESFGARVGWDEPTRCASVDYQGTSIKLILDSNEMDVNGNKVILDVPAQVINDRTFIPLRALVEALGKNVFWDDRGLIVISDYDIAFAEELLSDIIADLDMRIIIGGKEYEAFKYDKDNYIIDLKNSESVPEINVVTVGGESASVSNASGIGQSATVSLTDNKGRSKNYTFKFNRSIFDGVVSTGSLRKLIIKGAEDKPLPDYNTFIYVEKLTDSTNFATYPERGIVDGIINTAVENRWAVDGSGWIQMDFGDVKNVHSMGFSGVSMDLRSYSFNVLASEDGVNWTKVKEEYAAPTTTDKMTIIDLGDVKARYIKMEGLGNTANTWNTWAEVRFYESAAQQQEDMSYWGLYFGGEVQQGNPGETKKLEIFGENSDGERFVIPADATITYTSADPSIATVDANGVLKFVGTGKTKISVLVNVNGIQKGQDFDVYTN